jgi:hypothetical protein
LASSRTDVNIEGLYIIAVPQAEEKWVMGGS